MAPVQSTLSPGAETAAPPANPLRTPLIGALVLWGLLGAAIIGIIFFGGFDGRPVDDYSAANPLRHHTYFGPTFLVWLALSALGIPRALQAITKRD